MGEDASGKVGGLIGEVGMMEAARTRPGDVVAAKPEAAAEARAYAPPAWRADAEVTAFATIQRSCPSC